MNNEQFQIILLAVAAFLAAFKFPVRIAAQNREIEQLGEYIEVLEQTIAEEQTINRHLRDEITRIIEGDLIEDGPPYPEDDLPF